MDNVNEYTKLMGEWLESSIDYEVIESVEETYNLLKASKAIALSTLNPEEPINNFLIFDVYAMIVETKHRNFPTGEDFEMEKDSKEVEETSDEETQS